jgi:murein DD-endopeptidase MepM/ murein hydrolase activator NlpD
LEILKFSKRKKTIHTIIKINRKRKNKEGNLLLLFVLFFFSSFIYFMATETLFAERERETEAINGNDLFILSEDVLTEESENIPFTYESFILAESSPCFIKPQVLGIQGMEERENIISYRVEPGENISMIAEKFNISADTIRWANNIKGNTVKEEDELLILPVTGVMYYVEKGDTLSEIAKMHKAKIEDIIEFNGIEGKKIVAGDRLIIPGGTPPPPPPVRATTPAARIVQSSFINPVPGGMITQGIHPYNAVDIYNHCGTPIVAAAAGRVTQVGRGTWPAGNFVKIDHGSVVVLYAHMQSIYVSTGDYVSQGKQIGTVGNTGRTIGRTGCHLHFDVLSLRIRNPFGHLPVGSRP